uniref:NADH-ubiquinone oxidoreductase chain 4 n=1 Tax=Melyridae sp. GENSP01 TaxID=1205563 RepID=A0A0S2MPJ1_9CUCU|nr:NADH deshydrogenase subunit 4 [Melyridae sp. GENSP01]
MMSFMFFTVFLIPVVFFVSFWGMQWLFIIASFLLLISPSMGASVVQVSYMYGWDLLSYVLVLLSLWICSLMIMASEKLYKINFYFKSFMFLNVVLLISLFNVFSSLNLFVFYLFFEVSLIPVLLMIMGWGYQPERIQAGVYLLFYTLLASLPMLVCIFYCYSTVGSLDFYFFQFVEIDSILMFLLMNSVFLVKMPMYFVHLWLPKAHVEAPIAGSMILAGVMLKLGGYGLMRMMVIFSRAGMNLSSGFVTISLVGGFIISLICVCQSDMKSLIAYSSVAHMGLALAGIMSLTYWGMMGSLLMMVAHGLCSSGLFCLANLNYERLESRSVYVNKGLMAFIPSLSLWWFLFCACNMAAPPSLNLLSEIVLINSIVSYSSMMMFFLILVSFFSAVYSLFLFSFTQHGLFSSGGFGFSGVSVREFLLLLSHYIPLNFFILKSENLVLWL